MKKADRKTTDEDMQRMFAYMDKLGINYTVNRNPSPEEIDRIKKQIKKSESIRWIGEEPKI